MAKSHTSGRTTSQGADHDGETFEARIARLSQSIDRSSGTMRVEMTMANPRARVPAGLAGNAEFAASTEANLRVPTSAVTIRDGKPVVVVVGGDAVEFRDVRLGRDLGRMIEVREGLRENDDVVLNPNGLLRPGDRVNPKGAS